MCVHRDDPAACLSVIDAHYGTHDPLKRPWETIPCDSCRLRPERIAMRPKPPKQKLPPDTERDTLYCRKCGKELCGAIQTYQRSNTGLCRECYLAARKNPQRCKADGCGNKARRGGYCLKHQSRRQSCVVPSAA